MIDYNVLNEIQREACFTKFGPILILAGAGSGKTRTIVYRMAHLIESGFAGKSILGITFTKKAAMEMQNRLHRLIGENDVAIGTFHATAYKILRENVDKTDLSPNFTIYDSGDQLAIINQGLNKYKSERSFDARLILSRISRLKEQDLDISSFSSSFSQDDYDLATQHLYNYYQEQLHFFNAIDFTDILKLTLGLFRKYPHVAQKYSQQFSFILIDEYQDTNRIQWSLLRELTSTHQNICAVGDDYQSIYGFRGSSADNILRFSEDYPNCKVFKLLHNYRSGRAIISLANELISKHQGGIKKELISTKDDGHLPSLWMVKDPDSEAKLIVHDIQNKNPKETAILMRSQNLGLHIEQQLVNNGIAYTFLGGKKFYNKKEIKDLTAYLSFIHNSRDDISLRRILNFPHRGIGITTLEKYLQLAAQNHISLYQALQENPSLNKSIPSFIQLIKSLKKFFNQNDLHNAVKYLIDQIKLMDCIEKEYQNNPRLLVSKRREIDYFLRSLNGSNIADFLANIKTHQETEDGDTLTLSTLHSAKGLEFENVYIIGVEEDILPHKKSVSSAEIQEELRLAYVGITRAKKNLVLTSCKYRYTYNKSKPAKLSRFFTGLTNLTTSSMDDDSRKNFFKNLISSLDSS
jgi:superfamily I DNA/RNA helicase